MKVQIITAIMLAALMGHAEESAQGTSFSSKKEVVEEPGAEKRIIKMAQPSLVRFLETGVMDTQAKEALKIMAQDKANEGKSLERMAIDAIKASNKQ